MMDFLIGDAVPWIIGAVAIIAGFFGVRIGAKKAGREEARAKAKEDDHERAETIRDRVERDRDQRVRDYDDAGWRD